jgi:hypothetical protein
MHQVRKTGRLAILLASAALAGCASPDHAQPGPGSGPPSTGGSGPTATGGSPTGGESGASTGGAGGSSSGGSDAGTTSNGSDASSTGAGIGAPDAGTAADAATSSGVGGPANPAAGIFPIPPGLTKIFDGTTLAGWDGDSKWSVNTMDAAIQGHTGGFNLLNTKMNYGDFRLILTERMVLTGPSTNHLGECFWGAPYAAGNFKFGSCIVFIAPHGSLWDYGGGGNVFMGMGAGVKTDWQQIEILAIASTGQILAAVNGVATTNYTRAAKGRGKMAPIGLQSHPDHAGDTPGLIEYKDIYVESPPKSMTLLTVKH